jgi:hypothetical protein
MTKAQLVEMMEVREERLRMAEQHLRAALPGTLGMPTAERAVKDALRIVARQAGKAGARVTILRADMEREQDEAIDRDGFR